jgi:glycosyltransferase involved in cell wall biosynthesis
MKTNLDFVNKTISSAPARAVESWIVRNPLKRNEPPAILVFSHLRWDFVFQRPQHLLTRFATKHSVLVIEEPVFDAQDKSFLQSQIRENGVRVFTPHLKPGTTETKTQVQLRSLIDNLISEEGIGDFISWYYTPMALPFTRHLNPVCIVYDCMDELSMFKGAHPLLLVNERELFKRADVVFTGGNSLYDHKRNLHSNIHSCPSSIDVQHFAKAREITEQPDDQKNIPSPRIGFFGVIDERMDCGIIQHVAAARPDWHLIILGPTAKIECEHLPQGPNVHYLGAKSYKELPSYIAGWDVAILPFALNASTRFISPTKTPEYLAAGKPVVSTAIEDVVNPYEVEGLVSIAHSPSQFVEAIETTLGMHREQRAAWLKKVDAFLADKSWDRTWERMAAIMNASIRKLEPSGYQTRDFLKSGSPAGFIARRV